VASELTMPKLSDSMADAVIVRWLKSPGEAFERGEGLIEVETDKATVVYEAESSGTIGLILAPEGATVAVGEPIATLGNGGRGTDSPQRPASAKAEPESASRVAPAAVPPREDGSNAGRPNATPVARRTAVELGVSLYGLAGTGTGGRITRGDVQRAAESGASVQQPARGERGEARTIELTATQATIARRMVESATTIPVFTVSADVDMSLIRALRRGDGRNGGDVPSLNDFVVKAAGKTLREFPRFNASYVDGKVESYSRINIGIAVAIDDALLVPVVFDADQKTLSQIAADTRRLADAARRRALQPGDLRDGTFTVSNLGMFGVRSFTAIIDPPQVAILAVGGVRRSATEDQSGGVALRDLMTVTLTCDHRVVYGADGARFLARLGELLERPLTLVS
jgi:pyruvate dehydrogenase E2 component (dihydrolipoamide acetyltransferase)